MDGTELRDKILEMIDIILPRFEAEPTECDMGALYALGNLLNWCGETGPVLERKHSLTERMHVVWLKDRGTIDPSYRLLCGKHAICADARNGAGGKIPCSSGPCWL